MVDQEIDAPEAFEMIERGWYHDKDQPGRRVLHRFQAL
jgi:hypothetical protein